MAFDDYVQDAAEELYALCSTIDPSAVNLLLTFHGRTLDEWRVDDAVVERIRSGGSGAAREWLEQRHGPLLHRLYEDDPRYTREKEDTSPTSPREGRHS